MLHQPIVCLMPPNHSSRLSSVNILILGNLKLVIPCSMVMLLAHVGCCLAGLQSLRSHSLSVWSLTWVGAWGYCVLDTFVCWLDRVTVSPLFQLAEIPLNTSSALPCVVDSFQFGISWKLVQGLFLIVVHRFLHGTNQEWIGIPKTTANNVTPS